MTDIYLRNTATIERLAKEILDQCAHFRRNRDEWGGDELRFWVIDMKVAQLRGVSKQAARRVDRAIAARRSEVAST
jgi:hypothetical protein